MTKSHDHTKNPSNPGEGTNTNTNTNTNTDELAERMKAIQRKRDARERGAKPNHAASKSRILVGTLAFIGGLTMVATMATAARHQTTQPSIQAETAEPVVHTVRRVIVSDPSEIPATSPETSQQVRPEPQPTPPAPKAQTQSGGS